MSEVALSADHAHDSFQVTVAGLKSLPAGVTKIRAVCRFKVGQYSAMRYDFEAYTVVGYAVGLSRFSTMWSSHVSLNTENYGLDPILTIVVETELPALPSLDTIVTYFGLVTQGNVAYTGGMTYAYKDGKWTTVRRV